jgi:hypothetical protein
LTGDPRTVVDICLCQIGVQPSKHGGTKTERKKQRARNDGMVTAEMRRLQTVSAFLLLPGGRHHFCLAGGGLAEMLPELPVHVSVSVSEPNPCPVCPPRQIVSHGVRPQPSALG